MKREARQNRFILVTQRLVAAKRETLQNNLNCLQGVKKEYDLLNASFAQRHYDSFGASFRT